MHPKGTFCPAVGRPGEHPPGRKVLRSGCAVLHPAAKVERVQSRIGLKVGWFSHVMYFVASFWYNPRVFDYFAWRFVSIDGFGVGIIIRVDGSFFMMTASRSRYPLLYFFLFLASAPSFGLYSPLLSRFFGFTAAFNRHFRAGFRLYYGI